MIVPWGWRNPKVYKRRLLLRPHGSGGRVGSWWNERCDGGAGIFYSVGNNRYFDTRAQVAQAVYKAHKKAEAKIRAMMPSVRYEWEEDVRNNG